MTCFILKPGLDFMKKKFSFFEQNFSCTMLIKQADFSKILRLPKA
ncbi:hypothetical protein [Fluoribacter dumoffii]|nr:hypothetical protein [Fluoribacter dumoffii]